MLAAALFAAAFTSAGAFGFEPITCDFDPSGPGSTQTFYLDNDGSEPIAVRVRILTRAMDERGQEANAPADDQFVVYPSRTVLKPNSSQVVRVKWKGDAAPAAELCYRILVEQLPVEFEVAERTGGVIRILFRYLGALYVVPPGAKPDVELERVTPSTDSAGRSGLELVFTNRGTAHVILNGLQIEVARGAGASAPRVVMKGTELAGIAEENLLPGARRRFFLRLPEDIDPLKAEVRFTYEGTR